MAQLFPASSANARRVEPRRTTVEELDVLLCQIESRIKKTPVFKAGAFLYANKSGARGVGGMGESARLVVTLARRLF
jgi:hypothetical protein